MYTDAPHRSVWTFYRDGLTAGWVLWGGDYYGASDHWEVEPGPGRLRVVKKSGPARPERVYLIRELGPDTLRLESADGVTLTFEGQPRAGRGYNFPAALLAAVLIAATLAAHRAARNRSTGRRRFAVFLGVHLAATLTFLAGVVVVGNLPGWGDLLLIAAAGSAALLLGVVGGLVQAGWEPGGASPTVPNSSAPERPVG